MNLKKYFSSIFFIGTLLLINTVAYGQGSVPCDPDDVACNAPLDTWVILFAAVVLIVTVTYLHHKQKAGTGITVTA